MESKVNVLYYPLCFIGFICMDIHFKPQKLDIVLKRIKFHLSSASTIRYRRAEVLAKVLHSIDIFITSTRIRMPKYWIPATLGLHYKRSKRTVSCSVKKLCLLVACAQRFIKQRKFTKKLSFHKMFGHRRTFLGPWQPSLVVWPSNDENVVKGAISNNYVRSPIPVRMLGTMHIWAWLCVSA
jgi:hypothetical protein